MFQDTSRSGLPGVGELPWGSHFCHFYRTREDLIESLVPYFKAGLEQNESCLWVTSEPFTAGDARTALRTVVPDLEARIKRGQIEIINFDDWYTRTGTTDSESTLRGWLDRTGQALANGYSGLRLTGNTSWLEHEHWNDFSEYERRVNQTFGSQRIIGLCSYCLDRCSQTELIDVVRNHEFTLIRRDGAWEQIESTTLRATKDELRKLANELEQRVTERTAELEASLRGRDEFLSVASHELKTPITSMRLYLDGLVRASVRGELDPDDIPRRLAKAQEQCRRLDKLIVTLLDVSQLSNQRMELDLEEVDLSALVQQTAERHEEQVRRAGGELRVSVQPGVVGHWDELRLEQVFTNLISNTLQHAAGTPVEVTLSVRGRCAVVSVSDEGPGIAPADQPRLFQRFSQVSARRHGGFGLGLWISRQIVEAHGGSIGVDSAPGLGATFLVRLPLSGMDFSAGGPR
ncbi:MEDS domain-containing protein [Archangium sp.]|jgi:signal transduction histidine kinase|uniref:MEDS domain-containing protein n=1 Tax=Archangium sp. TaxID=1872627 RepID=UPI002EDA2219